MVFCGAQDDNRDLAVRTPLVALVGRIHRDEPPPQAALLFSFGLLGPDAQLLAPYLYGRLGVRLEVQQPGGDFGAPPLEATMA